VRANADAEITANFLQRASAIAAEPSDNRRALLTDSLVLDAAAECRRQKDRRAAAGKLRDKQAELRAIDTDEARRVISAIDEIIDAREIEATEAMIARADSVLTTHIEGVASAARRQAVLSALAGLGYEIRDTMSTAWVNDGRLVLRKPQESDYGVELLGPATALRVQARVVGSDRPEAGRNARRDEDMEVIWCSEFATLQELLAKAGAAIQVERAEPAGARPIKSVGMPALSTEPIHRTVLRTRSEGP
jgi:hypothetical protein